MGEGALSDLKVVELGHFISGPYCGKLLADFGAEVIKVEEPRGGDEARRRGPFPGTSPHPEKSGLFLYLNTNKMSITLNIESATGREVFKRLMEKADVLIEDYSPGTLDRLGMGYEYLGRINPGLVVTSITPFGQEGPYRYYRAYHLNSFHASGQGYLLPTYSPDDRREPVKGAALTGDYDCGLCAAVATLAAIQARRLTGRGQHVDISKQEALATLQRVEIGEFPNIGKLEKRTTSRPVVGRLVHCKDGYEVLMATDDRQWQGIVSLMDNPEWASEAWCRDMTVRGENAEKINALIGDWSKDYTKDEVHHRGQTRGALTAPVNTVAELVASPQLNERGFFVDMVHPEAGSFRCIGAPFKMSGTPWELRRHTPLLGEHTDEVYCGRLGYARQDLVRMREAGVI